MANLTDQQLTKHIEKNPMQSPSAEGRRCASAEEQGAKVMKTEKWSLLMAWYAGNHKTLPRDVSDAIETLIDERQSEDDDEDDDYEDEDYEDEDYEDEDE